MATVKQDWEKTVHYFKAAAEHGHPGALFQLALGYQKGSLGLQRNLALADQLIQQSAKAGYTPAQRFLGFMYREGWVITDASTTMAGSRIHHKKSDKMAFQWFYRAAQRHDLYAYILVGQCYEQGRGVPVNRKTALEYYQRAAEKENSPYQAKAQHAMADLLLRMGRVSEAYHWFTLAASRQDDIEQEEEEPCDEEPLGWYDHWPMRRAKLMVARYHLHGWGGVTIDRQRAFNILTELTAHTNEDGHAHYWLATCYLEGIPDVCEINHAEAFQHYSIAAETSVLDSEYQVFMSIIQTKKKFSRDGSSWHVCMLMARVSIVIFQKHWLGTRRLLVMVMKMHLSRLVITITRWQPRFRKTMTLTPKMAT